MTNDPLKRLHVHHLVFFFVMQDNCRICEYPSKSFSFQCFLPVSAVAIRIRVLLGE